MSLIFDFQKLGDKKEAATKNLITLLKRSGIMIVGVDASKIKRSSGVSFKELGLTANDSQRVILMIKQTGDIFKVKVNGSELPIKNQNDPMLAINEIAKKLDSGRLAFQRKLAKQKVAIPKMKSTVITKEKALSQREAELDKAISEAKSILQKLKAA